MQSFFSARKPEAVANEGGAILSPPPSIKYGHYLLPCLHAACLKLAFILAMLYPGFECWLLHMMAAIQVPLPDSIWWHTFCPAAHTSVTKCSYALTCESGDCFCSGNKHQQAMRMYVFKMHLGRSATSQHLDAAACKKLKSACTQQSTHIASMHQAITLWMTPSGFTHICADRSV